MGRLSPRCSLLAVVLAVAPVGVLSLLASPTAHAQQALAGPLIELVPPGEVVGDGATSTTVHVLALDANGNPLSGLTGKPTVNAGKLGTMDSAGPGLYKITYTPPKVDTARSVEIILKGKTADKQTVDRRFSFMVVPPLSHQVTVASNPAEIVLGQDGTANLSFTLAGNNTQPLSGVELEVHTTAGTVSNLTHLGNGQFTALFTPPNQPFPQLAIITVADKRDPTRTYGAIAVPMVGKANFPVRGLPNSRVLVKVGDREFGPIQADGSGNARVPLIVSPGIETGTITSVLADQRNEEKLDLKVPVSGRVLMFPMPASVPADPTVGVPVRVFVANPTGGSDAAAQVTFTATAGTVSAARHEGNGVYVATYTPPASNTSTQVTLTAVAADTRGPQSNAININLVPTRPAVVKLSADPTSLAAGATQLKVFAHISGADGAGMTKRGLEIVANGADLQGTVRELGSGDYQATFTTTGSGPVDVLATATAAASSNPLRRVLAFPSRESIPNDGLSSTMITVLTLDEFGYPVANVPVAVKVTQGDGSAPATATSNASGIAQIFYTAGRTPGLVRLDLSAGDHHGSAALIQAPKGFGAAVAMPISGSEEDIRLGNAWRKIVQSLRVERAGAPAVAPISAAPAWGAAPAAPVPAATPTAGAGGPIAKLSSQAIPASASAGDVIEIEVVATNAAGAPVDGQTLDLLTSAGAVGPLRSMGGGRYRVTLTIPAGTTGEVKVSAASGDGGAATFLKIPITTVDAGAVWGATPAAATSTPVAATPTPATSSAVPDVVGASMAPPASDAKIKKARTPGTGDHPWLRVGAGYAGGLYSYAQTPLSSQSPLYQGSISFGSISATEGSSPAPTAGLAVNARAWIPSARWLGVDASIRSSYYSVQIPDASDLIPDWYTAVGVSVIPRYIKESGDNLMYVGARVGFSESDFMVYRQELSGGATVLNFGPLYVPSLDLGAEVGAEIGDHLFGSLGGGIGLANASALYAKSFDLGLGYALKSGLFIDGGFLWSDRSSSIWLLPDGSDTKSEVGTVADRAAQFTVGLGYQI